MLEGGRKNPKRNIFEVHRANVWRSALETISKVRALLIGGVVGTVVGLIPGAGGQIAGLVAYDQSRRFSKNSAKYGTGESEGVVAAESANNAMVGPSLVPLLTLSVPGSPTAAVLLGGLLIHGIFPGPDLFQKHGAVAFAFINSMLIGQILMLVFGLAIAGLAARVIKISPPILAAAIFILSVYGSYSVQNSMADVAIMLALGMGMYFLAQYGFSPAPLVLGIILGPIAEHNYVQGRILGEAQDGIAPYFLTGWLNILLIALVLFSLIYSVVTEIREKRRNRADPGAAAL